MESWISLRSGIKIPVIGYGPGTLRIQNKSSQNPIGKIWCRCYNKFYYRKHQEEEYINIIAQAFKVGFRLLDFSMSYGNLNLIKKAIEKSLVQKDELFLTSRISNVSQFKGNVRESFMRNLDAWGVNQIDLLQFHWPVTNHFLETWQEMIRLKQEGYVNVLGVANCHPHHIELLEKETGEIPEINQIEVHPLFTQKTLIEYCKSKGITVEAYTPIARFDDRLVRLPLLKKLEKKYDKNFVQIILRWHIQNGIIPIIRTRNASHLKTNIDVFDFSLSEDEMKEIDSININSRLRFDPDNCDFTIL